MFVELSSVNVAPRLIVMPVVAVSAPEAPLRIRLPPLMVVVPV